MKKKIIKPRIKVAPPSSRHKSKKDYNRKEVNKVHYCGNYHCPGDCSKED